MSEKAEKPFKMRTSGRRYYTEYVSHMVRFFLTCPDGLDLAGRKTVDVTNWLAVQSVWATLDDEDKAMIRSLYSDRYASFPRAVDAYLADTGALVGETWRKINALTAAIARERGLI